MEKTVPANETTEETRISGDIIRGGQPGVRSVVSAPGRLRARRYGSEALPPIFSRMELLREILCPDRNMPQSISTVRKELNQVGQ